MTVLQRRRKKPSHQILHTVQEGRSTMGLESKEQAEDSDMEPPPLPTGWGTTATDLTPLPERGIKRIAHELKRVQQTRKHFYQDHGMCILLCDPEGTNLRSWRLCISSKRLPPKSKLRAALLEKDVEAVDIEIFIADNFPLEPPALRVIRPTFEPGSFFVHRHGALCMEALSRQGWSPTMTLMQLGIQVRLVMSNGTGRITSSGAMTTPGQGGRDNAEKIRQRLQNSHKEWNDNL